MILRSSEVIAPISVGLNLELVCKEFNMSDSSLILLVTPTLLFGILGKGKSQIAYAKVTLNVVDVTTSEVVYSVAGAGEYSLSEREVIGFGSTASYDATLNGKVLDLAIRESVNNLVNGIETGAWKL